MSGDRIEKSREALELIPTRSLDSAFSVVPSLLRAPRLPFFAKHQYLSWNEHRQWPPPAPYKLSLCLMLFKTLPTNIYITRSDTPWAHLDFPYPRPLRRPFFSFTSPRRRLMPRLFSPPTQIFAFRLKRYLILSLSFVSLSNTATARYLNIRLFNPQMRVYIRLYKLFLSPNDRCNYIVSKRYPRNTYLRI